MATVRLEGLKEFRRALRDAGDATPRELTKELKQVSGKVASRAKSHTKGRVAAAVKPFAQGTNAGIVSKWPGARVHEFAQGGFSRTRRGQIEYVNWPDPTPTPRYAYRAAEELQPEIGDQLLDAVQRVAKRAGWL